MPTGPGRPTKYSKKLADLICERVATHSRGLVRLCNDYEDMPSKFTVNRWRYKHPEFSTQYAHAKLVQADLLAEECLDMADDAVDKIVTGTNLSPACESNYLTSIRSAIDTRKWLASKLLPKQYGQYVEEKKTAADSLVERLIDKLGE